MALSKVSQKNNYAFMLKRISKEAIVILLLIFLSIYLTSKIWLQNNIPHFRGNIEGAQLSQFLQDIPEDGLFAITSSGGYTSAALSAAKIIDRKRLSIIIVDECLSACAEIVLAAAKSIEMKNFPFVGFHQNTLSAEHYTSQNKTASNFETCNWNYSREMEALYINKGLNIEFWKDTMNMLHPRPEFREGDQSCIVPTYNFEHRMWLPNSQELKKNLGLRFDGLVAADNKNCALKKVSRRWPRGTTVMVGRQSIISRGWIKSHFISCP